MPKKRGGQTRGGSGKDFPGSHRDPSETPGGRPTSETLLVGDSPQIAQLRRRIVLFADSAHPVLIEGESGTGKELVARGIHHSGRYRDQPFVTVDCGAIVPTLIESELFGHVRGAFTGAFNSKVGLIAMAEGGTIFLDEISELPSNLQAKLLRVLQEKEVRPVGSTVSRPVKIRIVAATNRDLDSAVQQNIFRRDLYFRLNVIHLQIPPLRERREDIPLLASHFLEELARDDGVQRRLSEEALRVMVAYDWPGNVRELEHSLQHASVLGATPLLGVTDLPDAVRNSPPVKSSAPPADDIIPLGHLRKQAILDAIKRTGGNKALAARLLGIGKTTLYKKLQDWHRKNK